jgi:hypothetical protein
MTIGKKLAIASAAVLSLTIVLCVFALRLTPSVAKLANTVVTEPLPRGIRGWITHNVDQRSSTSPSTSSGQSAFDSFDSGTAHLV